jgi:hypothetical protein
MSEHQGKKLPKSSELRSCQISTFFVYHYEERLNNFFSISCPFPTRRFSNVHITRPGHIDNSNVYGTLLCLLVHSSGLIRLSTSLASPLQSFIQQFIWWTYLQPRNLSQPSSVLLATILETGLGGLAILPAVVGINGCIILISVIRWSRDPFPLPRV